MDFHEFLFLIASFESFEKATIWGASPLRTMFAGFLAGFFLLLECHFWQKTLDLMIFHQNDRKMI